jgi:3-dehydroquinate synthase
MLNGLVYKSKYSKIITIVDKNTNLYCLDALKKNITFETELITIPSGDANKNLNTLQSIWEQLLALGADRKALILNLGGGVVTDIGGFAASTYKRGVEFIHIPTTLLAMIDAAIGGKNGINFMQAKNQIGNINQPEMVLINDEFLKTLPAHEFDSGFAEMLKHGLIADAKYFQQLIDYKLNNEGSLLELIKKSVQIKHEVISKDPKEKDLRKILNFGHTLGHAIESLMTYQKQKPITHGHAVALGMILATYISKELTDFAASDLIEVKKQILSIFKKIHFTNDDIVKIIDLLKFDKKNTNGEHRFVLLNKIGEANYDQVVSNQLIQEAFQFYMSE